MNSELIHTYETKIDECGRISLPANLRIRHDMSFGATVVIVEQKNELRISTPEKLLCEAQEYFLSAIPVEVSLVDELIEERRDEAKWE